MKNIAVILSGCGVFDGAEIHESVFALLAIEQGGAKYQCFAPDVEQFHVVNHLTGNVEEADSRNVLVESARIARGEVKPLTDLNVEEFDALVLPGGFGAAKNLCNFAIVGADAELNPQVEQACKAFASHEKAAGYACIAPALISKVYGGGVRLTIGNDQDTADALTSMGAEHINCNVDDVVVDEQHKVVSTPAYMLASDISQAYRSVTAMVNKVLELA